MLSNTQIIMREYDKQILQFYLIILQFSLMHVPKCSLPKNVKENNW